MIKTKLAQATLIGLALLCGCSDSHQSNGVVFGGVSGLLLTNSSLGVLIGAIAGSSIGRHMDEQDRKLAELAASQAVTAPAGQKFEWSNPNTGHSGSAKTLHVSQDAEGHECRQIEQEINIDGKSDVVDITVCFIDGHWTLSS